ncbi:MAG: LamG domain-containing protein [Armatimonadetes bacterium]|nr:LamG domain-containing protein [Armatimonadota bacterium]
MRDAFPLVKSLSRRIRPVACATFTLVLLGWMGCPDGVGAAEAPVPPGRVFYASFDDGFDAIEGRGGKTAQVEGKPRIVPGRAGQAVLVGDLEGSAGLSYPTEGNFSLERGTIALWVQPVNWSGDDRRNHVFFNAWPEEGGLFSLYKYTSASWGLTFFLDPGDGPRGKLYCYQPVADWRPGEWHHVACAWSHREGMHLYVDGRLVKSALGISMPRKLLKPTIRFGGVWQANGGRTLLDEAMIFDRMLDAHEVARLAGQPAELPDAESPRDVPGVALAHAILGQRVLAHVYRDALGEAAESARLELLSGDGQRVAEQTLPLKETTTLLELDMKPLPRGRYQARLTLFSGGKPQAVETLALRKETEETWESAARIAKKDTLLPPFTPLKVTPAQGAQPARIAPYGREYLLEGSGLPSQIHSDGHPLLTGAVRVVAEGAGALAPKRVALERATEVQARLTGGLDGDGIGVETAVVARYDGTLWTTLRFQPKKPVRLERLRVEIPIREAEARYLAYIAMGRVDNKRLGYDALPAGEGVVWRREFLPSIWIGTEERGLGWYAESDEHWDTDGEEALTVERRGGTALLCMNVIRQPREVTEPFTIEFGLQATPVRPLAPDWRANQWVSSAEITQFFLHLRKNPYPRPEVEGKSPSGKVCYLYAYHDYFTSTLPKDPEELREMISRAKAHGLFCTPYTDTTYLPESFGDLWMREAELRSLPGARAVSYGPVSNASVCHNGPFGDWFVWYVAHLAREYGSNGIYLDDTWTYGCMNAAHGCGYVGRDGKRRPTYPLRARHETYRRLREVFAATGQPFWITMHMSGGRVPPLPTYGDCLLLAEERYHDVAKNPDYCENTTPEEWRASFATEAWGIPVVVLPQFKMNANWMKDPELAHRLMAAVVPHDAMIWPIFSETETVTSYRRALMEFGIGEADTRFIPYWKKDAGLECAHPGVKLSAYQRPGKLLLLLANWTAEDASGVTVSLAPALLEKGAPTRARDALSGEAVPVTAGGRLVLAVPAKRVRLVEVVTGR